MILEIAQIDVKSGMETEFETGVKKAAPIFKRAKGCKSMRICIRTTGSQNAPVTKYKISDVANQGSLNGRPSSRASNRPVTGCATTAVAVNRKSASTTDFAVRKM